MGGITFEIPLFLFATFAGAFVAGLSGFAFGIVAASLWLFILTPLQSATLIIAFGLLVQGYSVWKLRRALDWRQLWPFVVGAALGVPAGITLLTWSDPRSVRVAVGVLLVLYSMYAYFRPALKPVVAGGGTADAAAGFLNGMLGGFSGLAGILVTIWCGLRGWPKEKQRVIFQPVAAPRPDPATELGRTRWRTAMSKQLQTIATVLAGLAMLSSTAAWAQSEGEGALQVEAKILLGDVRGRIDHMAVDLKRQRLFVAELGNDSVGVVDLANHSLIRTILGLSEPQGVGYESSTDMLIVANARDGSVRLLEGSGYKATGRIELGSDADNVRIDAAANSVVVGFGDGGLAMLDPSTRSKVQGVPLKAHPESFQIVQDRIFVNLPDAHAIAVVDGTSGKQLATWPMVKGGNFAMAADHDRGRILVAFRSPPELAVFASADGKPLANVETCGDVDDLFIDAKRSRVYVSCGAGYVDVFGIDGATYRRTARVPTAAGARTSLFVPELDRLLVAVRAGPAGPASVWVFKPLP